MNQNCFCFEVTNAVIASFCMLGDFVMIKSYFFFEVMNAVIARVLDCFYLMEHSMLHPYKFRDCKNTVFCISNMQKTVFFQSLRMIFKKKIHFWGITECSKHYFSNSCIDHFKTKVAWIHHNIQEILLLPSLHLSPPYLCSKVSICQVVWLSGCQVVRLLGGQVVS